MKLSAQALYRLGGWCLALLITALSLVPPDLRPESGTPLRFEHFAIFCATGAAFGLGYRSQRLSAATGLLLFAGALEFAQMFAPGRYARISDFLVDAFAACVGVALTALVSEFANTYRKRWQKFPG
jgi:VanZ family protein